MVMNSQMGRKHTHTCTHREMNKQTLNTEKILFDVEILRFLHAAHTHRHTQLFTHKQHTYTYTHTHTHRYKVM